MKKSQRTDKSFHKHIGAIIRSHRIRGGLNQTQLAEKLGVTFQQVQKYEKGANRLTVENLIRIANALGVRSSGLLAEMEIRQPGATVKILSRRHLIAANVLSFFDDKEIEAFLAFAKALGK